MERKLMRYVGELILVFEVTVMVNSCVSNMGESS